MVVTLINGDLIDLFFFKKKVYVVGTSIAYPKHTYTAYYREQLEKAIATATAIAIAIVLTYRSCVFAV